MGNFTHREQIGTQIRNIFHIIDFEITLSNLDIHATNAFNRQFTATIGFFSKFKNIEYFYHIANSSRLPFGCCNRRRLKTIFRYFNYFSFSSVFAQNSNCIIDIAKSVNEAYLSFCWFYRYRCCCCSG